MRRWHTRGVSRLNRDWVAGVMLLLVGGLLLGNRLFPDLVPMVPLLVGLALLAFFLLARSMGALVAGGVTTGVGVGVLVATRGNPDFGAAGFLISLAGGFYLVWILGLLFEVPSVRWWPVVPGSLLLAAGAVVYAARLGEPLKNVAVDWWPVLPIAMGAYLLMAARFRSHAAVDDETSEVPAAIRPQGQPAPGAAGSQGGQPAGGGAAAQATGSAGPGRPGSDEGGRASR